MLASVGSPLPKQLLRLSRWVNYIPGKKIPLCPLTGRAAFKRGTNRHDSLASYKIAAKREHLGLEIDDPYIGVDLDKVIGEDGELTKRGRELYEALPRTYTEYSPSGRGLHLWYRVKSGHDQLPNSAVGDHIEIYSRLRWFTVTGESATKQRRDVRIITLEQSQAIFALGVGQYKKKIRKFDGPPGLWSMEALDCFLSESEVEYRKYSDNSFRVRCPGASGWPDGVRHDDDGLNGNATTVAVLNGYPVFYCHHAKCRERRWVNFREFYDRGFSLDSWIAKVDRELRRTYR